MKTLFYKSLSRQRVRCDMCRHHCVIRPGHQGRCRVRENRNGMLYTLNYPLLVARAVDPIEKKPLFHFKPGSRAFSIASAGCNFTCSFCQNADISQDPAQGRAVPTSARDIVNMALAEKAEVIAFTYTEPTIYFELALETATLARSRGLHTAFVTNGFMSPQVLNAAAPVLDAANVDLKAFTNAFYTTWCNGRLEPVKQNLIQMKSLGILVEVTTLVIPGLNDHPRETAALAEFIAHELGPDTPWHISRFYPCHQMTHIGSTPDAVLERVYQTGKAAGLSHVYIGNAPHLQRENTCCPACGTTVIRRQGYQVHNRMSRPGVCPGCGHTIYGVF